MTVISLRRKYLSLRESCRAAGVGRAGPAGRPCGARARPDPSDGQWDPTLPKLLSAGAPGDPLAIANASLAATAQATQITMDLGRNFLSSLGHRRRPDRRCAGPGPRPAGGRIRDPARRIADGCAVLVGRRQTQRPEPWASTPARGTVGFDCSGFTQFAFAGVGVLIPKYSGDQYNTGRKVPQSQAKRGDLLFWGPGGSQHVAIYPRRRPDAGVLRQRGQGHRQPAAAGRPAAVSRPDHRILSAAGLTRRRRRIRKCLE